MKKRILKKRIIRLTASFLLMSILYNVAFPTIAFALTGGPSQPEVQSFQPIGTSEMVDAFSGDFKYNIPLLDVEGYPMNLVYGSNITMDQEASWVGLGWNVNPGVVNRGVRGIPDDFKGDQITKKMNMKPNKTVGVNAGVGGEIFGYDGLSLQYTLGLKWNNYTGFSASQSLNLNLSAGLGNSGSLGLGLGLTSSSDEGLTISPRVSLSAKLDETEKATTKGSLSLGCSYNSRGGLKTLTVSADISRSQNSQTVYKTKDDSGNDKYSKTDPGGESEKIVKQSKTSSSQSFPASFNFTAPTYSPQISLPMKNFTISGNFKVGGELWGLNLNATVGGFYSKQSLSTNSLSNPAYGYLFAQHGTGANAIHDFNREKDGPYTESTPGLPLANFTNDMFSVSGQGAGGSYRPFRSDIGTVYDPEAGSTADAISIGAELGLGNLGHIGVDLGLTITNTNSGRWTSGNNAYNTFKFRNSVSGNDLYEPAYFKEANEKTIDNSTQLFDDIGGSKAVAVKLNVPSKFNVVASNTLRDNTGWSNSVNSNYRSKRELRNQSFSYLSRKEINDGYGLQPYPNLYNAPDHHIAEVTTLGNDGKRYVYGIAAYNTLQREISFAVDKNASTDIVNGTVSYSPSDITTGNSSGRDNYFSETETPPFAHSYLLTSVLSSDYIDNDNVQGPSDGDYGSWVKFSYNKSATNYKWRSPYTTGTNQSSFNFGMFSDDMDNKSNIVYGEKELWYMDRIESKNYVAIFHTSNRDDSKGASGVNGGVDNTNSMKKLDKIELYNKHDMSSPIKTVHFEYDYSLCPGVKNNPNGGGKLTLKKVYFTYYNSNKGRFSPYEFTYSSVNPSYKDKAFDRWGYYQGNLPSAMGLPSVTGFTSGDPDVNEIAPNLTMAPPYPLTSVEFPYVRQNNTDADILTQAWVLKQIELPSGGIIRVNYESDDYAYVQNKAAMQMCLVSGLVGQTSTNDVYPFDALNNSDEKFIFKKLPNVTTSAYDYASVGDQVFFKFLVNIRDSQDGTGKPNYEYVPGYARVAEVGEVDSDHGFIRLQTVDIKDNPSSDDINPIALAGVQFGRIYMPKLAFTGTAPDDQDNLGVDFLNALLGSGFIANIIAAGNLNKDLYQTKAVANEFYAPRCWFRLKNPIHKKYGGGSRVKQIIMADNWNNMSGEDAKTSLVTGQEYTYKLENSEWSSGVAAYEPQLGGDENPLKVPVYYSERKAMAPDDRFYMEEPFGETFFPGASVGYSRVEVRNVSYEASSFDPSQINGVLSPIAGVTRHATGHKVHEFYTAKDFPTIADRTTVQYERGKTDPFSISSLFNFNVKDYATVSQGYVVELNDMHGKPKGETVYQQGNPIPISKSTFKYKALPYGASSQRLVNENLRIINPDGSVPPGGGTLGVFYDMIYDTRESTCHTIAPSIGVNLDFFYVPPFFFPFVPMVWPGWSEERTQFRSGVITKVVQRFGILEETIAEDLGSKVSSKNLAFDSQTGEVLVTQTVTNFNDSKYTLNFPGYWFYKSMGLASKNIGLSKSVSFSSNGVPNAPAFFMEGDEIEAGGQKAWITGVSANSITAQRKDGTPLSGTMTVKIIRSGYRNVQSNLMASITTLENPLNGFGNNTYDKMLEASAIEYSNGWKTYCDCPDIVPPTTPSTNPYINGTKGIWKPNKNYAYLTGRSATDYNSNNNIRRDGVMSSFSPFYKQSGGNWLKDQLGWTYASEVTEFDPYGQELENKDALERYSAATFGYNQSQATSVSSNSQYREVGVDNFEDYGWSNCADNHFKFKQNTPTIVSTAAHTGKNSIKVNSGNKAVLVRDIADCNYDPCLGLSVTGSNSAYQIIGGTPGTTLSYSWTILTGTPSITISNNGRTVNIYQAGGATASANVTVTDPTTGCSFSFVAIYPGS